MYAGTRWRLTTGLVKRTYTRQGMTGQASEEQAVARVIRSAKTGALASRASRRIHTGGAALKVDEQSHGRTEHLSMLWCCPPLFDTIAPAPTLRFLGALWMGRTSRRSMMGKDLRAP